jgi:hypothetical protein
MPGRFYEQWTLCDTMWRRSHRIALAPCLALCLAAPAVGQNPNAAPAFGTVYLASGFTADPRWTAVVAGGPIAASSVSGACRGYVSSAPTLRLDYSGSGAALIISADASADTTLLIRAPDGRFYCDDDSGTRGLNPAIRYDPPRAGRYDIWVGSFRAGETVSARVYFSGSTSQ